MAPILDGLLDAELDLHLLSLTLQDAGTHTLLTQVALVKPHDPASSAVLPPVTPSHHHYHHHHLYHHHHTPPPSPVLAPATPFLYVPHLRLPWASTLSHLLLRHLSLRLQPPPHAPRLPDMDAVLRTLSAGNSSSLEWKLLVHAFYPPLAPPAIEHNRAVLARLRTLHRPHILERFATCVRLAFVNSLLFTLSRSLSDTRRELASLQTRMAPTQTDDMCPLPYSNDDAQPDAAAMPTSTTPTADSTTVATTPAAMPSNSGARKPSARRRVYSPPAVITARRIASPPTPSSFAHGAIPPSTFLHHYHHAATTSEVSLVHGVVVKTDLLPTFAELIRQRFGIVVLHDVSPPLHATTTRRASARPSSSTMPPAGSLASICNHGGALLRLGNSMPPISSSSYSVAPSLGARPYPHAPARRRAPPGTASPRPALRASRGPHGPPDERMDAYLHNAFNTTWSTACNAAITEARSIVDSATRARLQRAASSLESGAAMVAGLRRRLVSHAVRLEVAGESLSRICAFSIALQQQQGQQQQGQQQQQRQRSSAECERWLKGLGDEYGKVLEEAKGRVRVFEGEDSRHAATLVAGIGGVGWGGRWWEMVDVPQ